MARSQRPRRPMNGHKRVMEITGADPLPYGIEPNRRMIEAVRRYAREQGIIDRPFTMEQLLCELKGRQLLMLS